MKQILVFVALLLVLGLNSCRCSDPPPIGPVEEQASTMGTEARPVDLVRT